MENLFLKELTLTKVNGNKFEVFSPKYEAEGYRKAKAGSGNSIVLPDNLNAIYRGQLENVDNNNNIESRAKELAVRLHQLYNQTYDDSPYTKHLEMVLSVARKFLSYLDCRDRDIVLAACWCHDLIEDTDVTKNHVSDFINYQVAEIVFAVTNEHASSMLEKNMKTFSKIGQNKLAVFVKLCDRIANTSNSKIFATEIYNKYLYEFPVFKYYLQNVGSSYHSMWQELESLYR